MGGGGLILEQMPGFVVSPVEPLGVTLGEALNDLRKRDIGYLQLQMEMGAHEAERVDLKGEALAGDVEDRVEAEPVLVVGKDVLAIVASQAHVINGSGYVDASLSWHDAIISRDVNLLMGGPTGHNYEWGRVHCDTV